MRKSYLIYETKCLLYSWYTTAFGIVFPVGMSLAIALSYGSSIPTTMRGDFYIQLILGMSVIIPLVIGLLSYAALYSTDLEKNIPIRLQLFGYSNKLMLQSKILVSLIYNWVFLIVYFGIDFIVLKPHFPVDYPIIPGFVAIITLAMSYSFLLIILIMLAHGIATFVQKFGPCYGIVMSIYFFALAISGLMGIEIESLPSSLRFVGKMLPFYYFRYDLHKLWHKGAYNYAPFVQAMILLTVISTSVLLLSLHRNKRKIKYQTK